jgi:LysM repeat protein
LSLQCLDGRFRRRAVRVVAVASTVSLFIPFLAASPALAMPSHRVAPGETLSEIAQRYGVSAAGLAKANDLADTDHIVDGQVLTIGGTTRSDATHRVAPGETLSHIAVRYSSTSAALAEANGLADADLVIAGMRLRVPTTLTAAASQPSAPTGATVTHTVGLGQTLSEIAGRYGVPTATIAAVNGISDLDWVLAGAPLQIPGQPAPASTAARQPQDKATVEALLDDAAARFGWDASLIKAIAWQESGWNNAAVSSADARGIMQVLPTTNRDVSERRAGRTFDLSDPADNVESAMHYLELLHDLVGDDTEALLAGYYQGVRSVRTNGRYPSTDRYIANILALRDRFEQQR